MKLPVLSSVIKMVHTFLKTTRNALDGGTNMEEPRVHKSIRRHLYVLCSARMTAQPST